MGHMRLHYRMDLSALLFLDVIVFKREEHKLEDMGPPKAGVGSVLQHYVQRGLGLDGLEMFLACESEYSPRLVYQACPHSNVAVSHCR